MLIPHYVVLYFLAIAVEAVAFIGWWGALFTGQLPEFAESFLSGFMRWMVRVQAYALLLTDQYPPFSLGDEPGYPVRIAIPARDRLNRVAVLFRIILVIPASLLLGVLQYGGMTIVAFIAWLIALITGKLPSSLHLAYTAMLRYGARVNCYLFMLTATYPGGLFGDGAVAPAGGPAPLVGDLDRGGLDEQAPADPAASGDEAAVYPGEETPAAETPADGTPGDPAASHPADWRLSLTPDARQLLGGFIWIGAMLWVAEIILVPVIAAHWGNATNTPNVITTSNAFDAGTAALDKVAVASNTLSSAATKYLETTQACSTTACLEAADAQLAAAFTSFASTVRGTPMPPSAVAAANVAYWDATRTAQALTQVSHLSPTLSGDQYDSAVSSIMGSAPTGPQSQQDLQALATALMSSV
jgi:hypothetical protein